MKIHPDDFRVPEGKRVRLGKWPTWIKPVYKSKDDYEEMLRDHVQQLDGLQRRLYASNEYAVLLIFQAMDAAGKDGAIRHVMSGINPQGCQVFSFKHPSPEELAHDFLWRTTRDLPERGKIGIFNRSYYEEVLIARVHPEILEAENLPNSGEHAKKISGASGIALSRIWSGICMPMALAFSNSSCICPRKNSASASLRA